MHLFDFVRTETVRSQQAALSFADGRGDTLRGLEAPSPPHDPVRPTALIRSDAVGRLQDGKPIELAKWVRATDASIDRT